MSSLPVQKVFHLDKQKHTFLLDDICSLLLYKYLIYFNLVMDIWYFVQVASKFLSKSDCSFIICHLIFLRQLIHCILM